MFSRQTCSGKRQSNKQPEDGLRGLKFKINEVVIEKANHKCRDLWGAMQNPDALADAIVKGGIITPFTTTDETAVWWLPWTRMAGQVRIVAKRPYLTLWAKCG